MILCSSTVRSDSNFEDAMSEISEAGFTDIDLLAINTWAHIDPTDLIKDFENIVLNTENVLKKNGLTMRAMNVGTNCQLYDRRRKSVDSNMNEIEALCKFMKRFSVSTAALQPLSKDPSRTPEDTLNDCIESLKDFLICAKRYDVALGLELHANSPFETIEAMKYLFEKIPGVNVIFDPTHIICMGYSLKECEFIIDHTSHVHIRDASNENFQKRFGQGEVDFEWIIKTFKQRGYNGYYSIESLVSDEYDALTEAVEVKKMLEGLLK